MSSTFASTLSASYTREHDAMTAGGQMIMGGHSEVLPPAAFGIDISVMPVRVSGSDPYRMGAWRLLPPARLPVIGVSFIAVVPPHPDMIPARTGGAMFMDADRGPKLYHDLRVRRTEAQSGSDECVKKDFHISPSDVQAGRWPMHQKRLR